MKKKRANGGGSHVSGGNDAAKDMSRSEARKQEAALRKAEEAAKKAEAAAEKERLREEKKAAKAQKTGRRRSEPDGEGKRKGKGRFRKFKLVLILVLVFAALLSAGAAVGGYLITKSDTNLPGVYVDGIFVGGMTREETREALEAREWDETAELALRVKLPAGVSFKLDVCEAGGMFTKENAVEAAYRYGHTGNWFENLYDYAKGLLMPVDVSEFLSLNDEYIRQRAQEGIEKFQKKTVDNGYTVDSKKAQLTLVKGAGQMEINLDSLCAQIAQALTEDQKLLEYDHIDNTLQEPDFEAIYQELNVEPQDAYFEEGSFEVVDEVVGCTFDVAEASRLWQEAQPAEKVVIPLTITQPEKTGEELRNLLFRDVLGSQTTKYTWSTDNRINNINLAASALDGLILMPGEVFSYNETVGQRTEAAGYLAAGAYNDGQVVQEVGGGICQVSSTLYCAAMLAQLETVERTNHYFKVDYLDWGLDATVSWPGPDFKFRNDREYPIKISAVCDNEARTLTIEIIGTDVDGSYAELWYNMGCVYDNTYTDVVIGYGVSLHRSIYDKDGNFLYQVDEPYGIYYKHDEDIDWPEPENTGDTGYEDGPDTGAGDNSAVVVPDE